MKELWYAMSKRGQGLLFTSKPKRMDNIGTWNGNMAGCYSSVVFDMEYLGLLKLPVLTFEDEPIKLTLTVNYG